MRGIKSFPLVISFSLVVSALASSSVASMVSATPPSISSVEILHFGLPAKSITASRRLKGYSIKITGQGFDSSSRVFLQGRKIHTTVISATEITARPRGMELTPGEVSLQVESRVSGSSNTVLIDITSDPSLLSIFSISPNVAEIGAQLTISGLGFTPTGNRVRFVKSANPALRGVTGGLESADGNTLLFDLPSSVCIACDTGVPCPDLCFTLDPGDYQVAVTNSNGLSNSLDFIVSSATGPIGIWGGSNIVTKVGDTHVDVEGPCFSGRVAGTLMPDSSGNFSVAGHYFVLAGPIRPGDQGTPAQFTGRIDGNILTLNITMNSFTQGPYTMVFGNYENIVHPCL
jgi:hypothetical protein